MRRVLLLLLFLTATIPLATCGQEAATEERVAAAARIEAETARLHEWFAVKYEEWLLRHPLQTTFLGRKDNYHRIDDMTEAAADRDLDWRRQSSKELREGFNVELLTPEARISRDIWLYETEQAERAAPFRRREYVFTQMQGLQSELPGILMTLHRVDEPADMDAYIARIGGVATAIEQLLERAKVGVAEGVRPPAFAYPVVVAEARGLLTGAPFGGPGDAPLWSDAQAKIAALEQAGQIDAARADALHTATREVLTTRFRRAYEALIAWCEQDVVHADRIATGVWKLPEGRAFYEERLAAATTVPLTAAEIHQIGLDEVARIRAEMEAIRSAVKFTGTLQDFFEFIREDEQFFFPNTDVGREGYLEASRRHLDAIRERLPDFFGLLPKAELLVQRVEPYREQDGAPQHYRPGTPDGSRPGVYYVHLSDMRSMPKSIMEAVAYHEGNPGHHMQISIAQELQGLPEFRTQTGFTAYTEGWALYAERLAKEMGGYQDPYAEFGRLGSEIWRAVRLVVDTGLHDQGWTEAQAVAYFRENSPVSDGQIRAEVQRYIVWPGQATAYKIGMLKLLELRQRAERQLGDRFDIRAFHDVVLGGGALPLPILERRVDEWIATQS